MAVEDKSAIYQHLVQHGPMTAGELPFSRGDKISNPNIRKLKVGKSGTGHSSKVGQVTTVYYTPQNDAKEVVRKFLDVNPNFLDLHMGAITTQFKNHSQHMKNAWDSVKSEYDLSPTGARGGDGRMDCPMCDDTFPVSTLRKHFKDNHN